MKKRKRYIVTMLFKQRCQNEYGGIQKWSIPERAEDDWIWFLLPTPELFPVLLRHSGTKEGSRFSICKAILYQVKEPISNSLPLFLYTTKSRKEMTIQIKNWFVPNLQEISNEKPLSPTDVFKDTWRSTHKEWNTWTNKSLFHYFSSPRENYSILFLYYIL